MKKTIKLVLALLIIFSNLLTSSIVSADDFNEDEPLNNLIVNDSVETTANKVPRVSAGSAIVMDLVSGRILYEKNAFNRSSIASTTKIMTAIVALENGNENEDVLVSKRAASISGSTAGLKEGKTYKLGDLLYALMLCSGNDAAIAIAEHVAGSVEAFAEMMNRKAAEIGATNTNFVTPHGLDNPQHFSTAYDLALITQYALKNEKLNKLVGTKNAFFDGRSITNTNEMLQLYPGADGVKTGYTGQAGRCLVTSATNNGWRIISIVLNCSSRAVRAQNSKIILDYAFQNYKNYIYLKKGQVVDQIKVYKGLRDSIPLYCDKDISFPLKQDEINRVEIVYNIPKVVEAPIEASRIVGTIDYKLDGKVLASTDVINNMTVLRKDFYFFFEKIFKTWARLVH